MPQPAALALASRSAAFAAAASLLAVGLWGAACDVHAQENVRAILLVARPGLPDPNFRESVVLVRHEKGAHAVGVIINRPTTRSLSSILPGERFARFTEPVHFGGPVALNALSAVFRADKGPKTALMMLPGVFFAVDGSAMDEMLSDPPALVRFFIGHSGWAPGQLDEELMRGDWYTLDADAATVFRKDTSALWRDLIKRARSVQARY